jgi:glycerophosphoryl diester phosphodiesterase
MSPRAVRLRALVASLAVVVGVAAAPEAHASSSPAATGCVFAAHRGYTAHHPENSLMSFRAGVHQHADYLEMDVQVTKDGRFAIMHDETINRTTTGKGRIIDKTWAQLRTVRLSDGEHVPSLGSVLAMAKPTASNVLLELKWVPTSRYAAFKRAVDGFGVDRVVVNSFSPYVVKTFHQRYPGVATALDTNGSISLKNAKVYGGVMPDYRHVSLSWLRTMRQNGIPTYLWALDKPDLWARYRGRATLVLTNKAHDYDVWRAENCT